MDKIRVVVVDNSVFIRKAICRIIEDHDDMEVVATGVTGIDAVKLAISHSPDVLTLDVDMPEMDGLTALKKIMESKPTAVIMVSSLTKEGADTTVEALSNGALDFIAKNFEASKDTPYAGLDDELAQKIRTHAATGKSLALRKSPSTAASSVSKMVHDLSAKVGISPTKTTRKVNAVAIGVSTGGPQALQKVIPKLPKDLGAPVFIVQHMPENFTASLAARLDKLSHIRVVEAKDGDKVTSNTVYIAKGGRHMVLKRIGTENYISLHDKSSVNTTQLHIPSVDVLFGSVAGLFGPKILGVIMTGMGNDGQKGSELLKLKGGQIIAQDESSSTVFGMPKAVIEAGLTDEIVDVESLAARIEAHCK